MKVTSTRALAAVTGVAIGALTATITGASAQQPQSCPAGGFQIVGTADWAHDTRGFDSPEDAVSDFIGRARPTEDPHGVAAQMRGGQAELRAKGRLVGVVQTSPSVSGGVYVSSYVTCAMVDDDSPMFSEGDRAISEGERGNR